jgi:hypothetical protein
MPIFWGMLGWLARMFGSAPAIKWVFKNGGLVLGIIELIIQFIVGVLIQLAKLAAGLCNITETDRSKDKMVNWIATSENSMKWVDAQFTKLKAWMYKIGIKEKE